MSTNQIDTANGDNGLPRLLFTAKEAAAALTMSPRKLWSLTNSGQFPHVRNGRSVRYYLKDIEAWIEQHRYEPRAQRPLSTKNKSSRVPGRLAD